MQLNGIGAEHSADMHHVTKCVHDHSETEMRGGTKRLTSPGAAARFSMRVHSQPPQTLSLTDRVQQLLADGRDLLRGIWRGSEISSAEETGEGSGNALFAAQADKGNDANVIKAAENNEMIRQNPYFAAIVPQTRQSGTVSVLQKARMKTRALAGRLASHLPGGAFRFQKQNSFSAKGEDSREEIRRRSRYRQDELEIDCILTDESYLLDSYDRKGGYSQLTTQK